LYAKNVADNIPAHVLKKIREEIDGQAEARRRPGNSRGLRQLNPGEHGRLTTVPSVGSVREKTGRSQSRFAELLGVSVRTLQEWEQGRQAPSGAAWTLLSIAAKNPRALLDVA
jgi:putative transcriptional regulator